MPPVPVDPPTTARDCYYHLAQRAARGLVPASYADAVAAQLRTEGDMLGTLPLTLPSMRTALTVLSWSALRVVHLQPPAPDVDKRRAQCGQLSALLHDVGTSGSLVPVLAVQLRLRDYYTGNPDPAGVAARAGREAQELQAILDGART